MTETLFTREQRPGRVVVGATGSPSSRAALRRAAEEARRSARILVPVLAWEPPGGEAAYRLAPEPRLAAEWEREVRRRLAGTVHDTLGPLPAGLAVEPAAVRGDAAWALNALADRPGDLLVLGAGPRNRVIRALRGGVRRRAVPRAQAPVLLVAAPELPRAVRRELRRITPDDFVRAAGRGLAC